MTDLHTNEQALRELFTNCSDIVYREISLAAGHKQLIIYMDGMVDTNALNQFILQPAIRDVATDDGKRPGQTREWIEQQLIAVARVNQISSLDEAVREILNAKAVILFNHETVGLSAELTDPNVRAVEEPTSEPVVRGPREGFTETLRTNTSMVRRKLKTHRLKLESMTVGKVSQTEVAIAYLEGTAKAEIVNEVRSRISRIQMDAVLESGYLEEFIEVAPLSPFPTVQNTERPDIVAANLLEGKIAIFTDGTPFVRIVPFTFWAGLQAAEDYYNRSFYSSAIRVIRSVLLTTSLFLPSLYVAIVNFHSMMLPTSLVLNFSAAQENTPFPTVVEAFMMELIFEGLREAGIRLPKQIGSAVSIVGALVIGQAAVQAGIVSAPVVIVVAGTGIASFTIPRYDLGYALRLLRFVMLILAGTLGLYGIALGTLTLLLHLVSLRSFGVPYFSPVAPLFPGGLNDVLWRAPRWRMNTLPKLMTPGDIERIPKGQKPKPNR
ncbi:spore germination protein [Paenibacillus tepidiphilus]|uniref:spore germination protein n=1 Tax=Paenibacillus tepidiphilus TaxID=2608683 RepID=UPI001EEFC980|nr:spore germination protein [Paenibacillus tepidiphilus]